MYAKILKYVTPLDLRVGCLTAVAGLRSFSGPAFFAKQKGEAPQSTSSETFERIVKVVAFGELIGDKLPMAPKRTDFLPLAARAASGAYLGAKMFTAVKQPAWKGSVVGIVSAVTSTFISFQIRKLLTKTFKIPDFAVAVAEDALVLSAGTQIQRFLDEANAPELPPGTQVVVNS